jgi:NADPH-dependent 2,4-dienoyl-CoA reductase/sulfur reductase-like enzyme
VRTMASAGNNAVKKVLIVGGVAGGASCAARLRRMSEDVEITIFERGPFVSFANCGLPYFVGGVIQVGTLRHT